MMSDAMLYIGWERDFFGWQLGLEWDAWIPRV